MKLKGIKISREAKILFGLMCLAAAILIWVNLATQRFPLFGGQQDVGVVSSTPAAPATGDASIAGDASSTGDVGSTGDTSVVAPSALDSATAQEGVVPATDPALIDVPTLDGSTPSADAATVDASVASEAGTVDATSVDAAPVDAASDAGAVSDTAAPVAGSIVDISAVSPDSTVPVTTPDAVSPTVEAAPVAEVAPSVAAAPLAARDVEIAELPFLVTEAPVAPVEEAGEEAAVAQTERPGEQRASINPFSPIVLAPVETVVADAPAPPADIQVVDVPSAPGTIGTVEMSLAESVNEIIEEPLVAEGPLPEAVLPAPAVASLPRPLPMATTPVAPEILRNMSSIPQETTLVSAETVEVPAVIREPIQATPATPAIIGASVAGGTFDSEVELEPVGSMASAATSGSSVNGAPLYAGASALSSYLRDNDVRFTGSAIGPVSVGVFSSKLSANPVVIPLGQTLPETEFVLTSLQGKEAEFSYGQEKQLLTLDLRR
jgi:hypothetical protein